MGIEGSSRIREIAHAFRSMTIHLLGHFPEVGTLSLAPGSPPRTELKLCPYRLVAQVSITIEILRFAQNQAVSQLNAGDNVNAPKRRIWLLVTG